MKIVRSFPALIAALLMAALPVAAPAQFSIGVGFTIGSAPPPIPYYAQPPAPYPNYQWTPGYWAWGPAGYYWVPGTWVAPPSVGLYWTPGYWGYSGGGYGWNAGYWGASVGFYGGINYGYGYPGSGFYGGAWNGGAFRYNTAVTNVNRTVIHNTYNKTVVNNGNFCKDCKNVSFNGGKGGTTAKPTQGQLQARKNGRAPTTDQKNQAKFAGQDRNQLASVNKGKPSLTASNKPFNDNNRPKNSAPITTADRQNAQKTYKTSNNGAKNKAPTTQTKPANNNKPANNKPANNNKAPTTQTKPANNNKMTTTNQSRQNQQHQQQQQRQQQQRQQQQHQTQPPRQHPNQNHMQSQNMQSRPHPNNGGGHPANMQGRPPSGNQNRPNKNGGNGQGKPPSR